MGALENADGEIVFSYTMLTLNADDHTFMRDYHQVDHEKRMVVILPKDAYRDWLKAAPNESTEFMHQYPADRLSVSSNAENKVDCTGLSTSFALNRSYSYL